MTTCIELIVYLEPSAEFKHQVEHFLDSCKAKYGPTTANKYGCHITMTGFFNVDTEDDQMRVKQLLHASLQDIQHKAPALSPRVERKSLLVRDKTTQKPVHLLLPISVPDDFHVAMENVSQTCAGIAALRLKKINHISLAYWDEPEATQEQQAHWCHAMEHGLFEKIQHNADTYFDDVKDPLYWDVVLYQRVLKGNLVGEPHVFRELDRWRV